MSFSVGANSNSNSNSLLHRKEETGEGDALQEIRQIFDTTIPKPSVRHTMRLERRCQSGISTPILRSPRANTALTSRRAHRRSLDSSLSHVNGFCSLKSHTVVPFSNTAGIIDSNETSVNLASTTTVEPVCYSSGMSNKTPETSRVIDTSRGTFSLSAEEAIAGLGLGQDGLNHLKKNFNLIDEDGNGMIDKVEFLRALRETDENGDIISDFTGSLVIIATHCDPNHCIPTNRFLQPFL